MGFSGSAPISIDAPAPVTPVVETHWTIARFAFVFLLLAAVKKASASTITPFSGLKRSPIGFGSPISLFTLRRFCYR